jgi:hypothetical protein
MPENWMDYKVGQEVFIVNRGNKGTRTIGIVGRKYARLEGTRQDWIIDIGTDQVRAKGLGIVGTVYESEAAYIKIQEMHKLREKMRSIEWRNYSDEQVKAIAEILGIEA